MNNASSRIIDVTDRTQSRLANWLVVGFFLLIAFVSYRLGFDYRGPIDEDAYQLFYVSPFGNAKFGLFFTEFPPRPFDYLFKGLAYKIIGVHFDWYFLLPPILYAIVGILMWRVLLKYFPNNPIIAIGSALVFLVYPAAPTRTEFTLLHIPQALLFFMMAIWILQMIDEKPEVSFIWYITMCVLTVASMLSYEQLAPVIVVIPLSLLLKPSPTGARWPRPRAKLAAIWWIGVFVFVLWRIYFAFGTQYGVFHYGGGRPDYSIGPLLNRYLAWVRMGILQSWIEAVDKTRYLLALRSPELRQFPLWLPIAIFLLTWLFGIVIHHQSNDEDRNAIPRRGQIRAEIAAISIALLLVLMAYITPPLAFKPATSTNLWVNRLNDSATPFLALAYVLGLSVGIRTVTLLINGITRREIHWYRVTMWAGIAMLTTIGSMWSIYATKSRLDDWLEKAEIWQGILETAPGIEPDTFVLLLKPPRADHLRGYTFESAMLALLYDDPTLSGDAIGHSPFITTLSTIDADGIEVENHHYDWDHVLLIQMSEDEQTLNIKAVDCLPEDLWPSPDSGPFCGNLERIDYSANPTWLANYWLFRPHVTGVEHNPFRNWLRTAAAP